MKPGVGERLLGFIEAHPSRVFWTFSLIQLCFWTMAPALLLRNLPLDVIEMYAWGHEWQLGYPKHPPAPAWILEALTLPFGRLDWTAYCASAVSLLIANWAIWRLGRDLLGEPAAVLSVLLTSLIYYYHLPLIEFNHNVLQMPLWALIALFGWRALERDRMADWLPLGACIGLSVYVKYSMAILPVVLIAFALYHMETRHRLVSRGFLAALGGALLVAAPHLYWMVQNDFPTLTYAGERARPLQGILARLFGPLLFPLSQALNHLGLLLVILLGGAIGSAAVGGAGAGFAARTRLARNYLLWIALAPVAMVTLLSLALGVEMRPMWGAPMFSFSALALMVSIQPLFMRQNFARMAAGWGLLQGGIVLALVVMAAVGSHFTRKPLRFDFPGRDIGSAFNELWRSRTGRPLANVSGDGWIAGNIAYYAADRPNLIDDGVPQSQGGVLQQDLRCGGRLIVWDAKDDQRLEVDDSGVRQFAWKVADRPWRIGWQIVPPAPDCR